MEVERLGLIDAERPIFVGVATIALDDPDVFEIAVDLVGRAVEDRRAPIRHSPDGLEDVEGSQRVRFEVGAGIGDARCDGDLRGEMEHGIGVGMGLEELVHQARVADVGLDDVLDPVLAEPLDVAPGTTAAHVIDDHHLVARLMESRRGVRADEPRSPVITHFIAAPPRATNPPDHAAPRVVTVYDRYFRERIRN